MVFNVRESQRSIKTEFPRKVREIEHVWIPMSDGTRLAARIWLPEDAGESPVPAILEYIPYRKNDFTALRDSIRHPYFAGHGYASIRVDMRGCGDSDGILYDEYLPQEQDDAIEVIEWIASQPWCTGAVGMIGKSWGGFNGLQVAARRPPALKTIITLCSTDDRYADDVHYLGGCVLASDMLWWASTMLVYNARPADPRIVGDEWRSTWLQRLEKTPPFVEEWMSHQRRDAYWKHGSVCENYADIEIPVFAVGGWADGYTNAILRLLEGLPGPRKGLIGPWAHEYPEVAVPGPAIGFLQECLRWWDHWLKGIDTGIMEEPMLRAWMQDSVPPQVDYAERPGRWVAETAWPSPAIQPTDMWLGENQSLSGKAPASEREVAVPSMQAHGLYAGVFCPFGQPGDLASDQRLENGLAVCFTSEPLEEPVEILGFPEVTVELSADRPNALLAVRLCDVAPDGASTLVSWGMLNLTHRESHEHPAPLAVGERYTVSVRLNAVGHVLPAGHRWQVALSPNYWPHAWPSPEPVTLTVYTGEKTRLTLPVRPPQAIDDELPDFGMPETAAVMEREILREERRTREVRHDLINGVWTLEDYSDEGARRLLPNGIEYGSVNRNIYTIEEGNPLSAQVRCEWTLHVGRGEWQTRLESVSTMSADAKQFYLKNELTAYEGETQVFTKTWTREIPRDHV
ncbi:CocE/NonD family hydrolase [Brevibacillus composti]|uniref:CocE/NonD family hydrolase n=1 Tax=Brevibacillus composti TaxID=2796470 RepID=A0A7T5ELT9_9BACL|nr:CocE/NonD family hydrolase [Brevibacillus composti]QQE74958.1 CocE/NonD family hydrolase [Brevibacillus composti]QUO42042.1 CocE/NonD family hydrolase [Brevibacillus composti]